MSHGLPDSYRVASAKLKPESLANPHIVLYNSSSFKGVLYIYTQCVLYYTQILDDYHHDEEAKGNGYTNGHSNGPQNGNSNGHTIGTFSNWKSFGDHKIRYIFFLK